MDGNPTIAVRSSEQLDVKAVDRALKAEVSGLSGAPELRQYESGASNLTYALDYPERSLVLRRPPFGKLPKGGHNMFREYRIMRDLKPVYPAVPNVVFYTDDESVIGKEFYVMDRVEGHIIHTEIPPAWDWTPAQTRRLCENFFAKLVELHQVDVAAANLSDFGKPAGYVERQFTGWNRRWERSWTEDVPKFMDVQRWLMDRMPADSGAVSVLHGDYRIDNCILNQGDPTRVDAVLDWEISALGDPLMDLGNTVSYWVQADDPDFQKMTVRQPSMAEGMMTRDEILAFYADRTGADVSDFLVYYVYGIWRLAVVIQQIYKRYVDGHTDDARFKDYGKMVIALGELARLKIASGKI